MPDRDGRNPASRRGSPHPGRSLPTLRVCPGGGAAGQAAAQTPGNPTTLTLTLSGADTVGEADGGVRLTVEFDQPAGAGGYRWMTFSAAGGSATQGDDYELPRATIPMSEGESRRTATLPIFDDDVDEDGETIVISASGEGLTSNTLTITVTDNDTRGVTVSPTDLSVIEEDAAGATYAVVLDSEPTADVTVDIGVTPNGHDLTIDPTTLTFTAEDWDGPQTVTVTASDDTDMDNDAATLSHTASGGDYTGVTAADVAVTVRDNDVPTAPTAVGTISDVTLTVGGSTSAVDVSANFSDFNGDTLTWTAESDDTSVATVTVSGSTVTVEPVAPGSAQITVTATDPDSLTATQIFAATVDKGEQTLTGGSFTPSSLTFDSPGNPLPTASIVAPANSAGSVGGPIGYTSTTTDICTVAGTTVTAEMKGDCIVTATAAANDDYEESAPLTLPALSIALGTMDLSAFAYSPSTVLVGDPSPTLTVPPDTVGGIRYYSESTSICTVESSSGAVTFLAAGTCTVEINVAGDNKRWTRTTATFDIIVQAPDITLSVAPATVTEADGAQTVTVTATIGATRTEETVVTVAVGDDTATAPADYATVTDFEIAIAANESTGSGSFGLTPVSDSLYEGDETVAVTGTTAMDVGWSVGRALLTIEDDDAYPGPLTLSLAPVEVAEGAGTVRVTLTASLPDGGSTWPAPVRLTTVVDGNKPVDSPLEAATEGVDFATIEDFTEDVVPAGMTTGELTFDLTVNDDSDVEGDELILVRGLSVPFLMTDPVFLWLTIKDNDGNTAPTAVGTISDVTLTVGGAASDVDVAANFSDADNDALTYTAESDDTSVVTVAVSGSTVTVTPAAAGSAGVTVTATDPGGLTATQMFTATVGKGEQTLIGFAYSPDAIVFNDSPPAVTAPTGNQGALGYASRTTAVCTADSASGVLTVLSSGVCTVRATAAATDDYNVATADAGVDITPAAPAIGVTAGDGSITLTWSDPGDTGIDAWDWQRCEPGEVSCTSWTAAAAGEIAARTIVIDATNGTTYTARLRAKAGSLTSATATSDSVTPTAGANNSPIAVGTISDVTLTMGGDTSDVDVSGNFDAVDNDPLTYTAESDNTSVATVTVTGSIVTVAPAAAGSTVITVTATDPGGLTATQTFTATVNLPVDDLIPSFVPESVAYGWTVGADIGSVQLPAASGGDGDLSYTLADEADIPAGVGYAAATRTFTGAPSAAGSATLTLTATDSDASDPDSAALTVAITVARGMQDLSGFAYSPARVAVDGAAPALTPPPLVADGAALTYASTTLGVCTVEADTGALTLVVPGDCTVEATAAATDNYEEATARFTVEVISAETALRERLAAVNESVMPELARAFAGSAAEAVAGRLDAALAGTAPAAPAGFADALSSVAGALKANERALDEGAFSWRRALAGKSFALGLADGDGAGDAVFWGAGEWRSLSLDDDPIEWEGETFAGYLGFDTGLGSDLRVGTALSWSEGSIDYTDGGGAAPAAGTLESRMTSVHPYAGLSLADGGRLWATVGWGRGEIEIDDEEAAGGQSSDTALLTAAMGGVARLASGGATAFDLKGEAQTARLEVDDNGDLIDGLTVNTRRLRLALEGSRTFALSSQKTLTPSLEAGLRWDGGDGVTGAGFEIGAGLGWSDRASGLTAEFTGRALAAHGGDLREWGASGFVRLDPSADGRGLSLSVTPSWGEAGSGLSQLWDDGMTARDADGTAPVGRIDAELGYGLAALDGAGLVTPYSGAALADDGVRRYRLGGRFGLGAGLDLSLEAGRRESAADPPEHGIALRATARW